MAGLAGSEPVIVGSNPEVISRLDAGGVAGRASTTMDGISARSQRSENHQVYEEDAHHVAPSALYAVAPVWPRTYGDG
jgi:hypothetical protein